MFGSISVFKIIALFMFLSLNFALYIFWIFWKILYDFLLIWKQTLDGTTEYDTKERTYFFLWNIDKMKLLNHRIATCLKTCVILLFFLKMSLG